MMEAENTAQRRDGALIAYIAASVLLLVIALVYLVICFAHAAVITGMVGEQMIQKDLEMTLLAALLCICCTAVGVLGLMHGYERASARTLAIASGVLLVVTVAVSLVSRNVIGGILGLGSIWKPGVIAAVCAAAVLGACVPELLHAGDAVGGEDLDVEAEDADDTEDDSDGLGKTGELEPIEDADGDELAVEPEQDRDDTEAEAEGEPEAEMDDEASESDSVDVGDADQDADGGDAPVDSEPERAAAEGEIEADAEEEEPPHGSHFTGRE